MEIATLSRFCLQFFLDSLLLSLCFVFIGVRVLDLSFAQSSMIGVFALKSLALAF